MPETFGSGTAFSGFDLQSVPLIMANEFVGGGGSSVEIDMPDPDLLYVVTAIDLVTAASGGSGPVHFQYFNGSAAFDFWVANTGTSTDTFSWRGFLPIVGGLGRAIAVINNGSGLASLVVSGFTLPAVPGPH